MDAEYPCARISLAEYLDKKAARPDSYSLRKIVRPELLRELRKSSVCLMKFPEGLMGKKCRGHILEFFGRDVSAPVSWILRRTALPSADVFAQQGIQHGAERHTHDHAEDPESVRSDRHRDQDPERRQPHP